MDEFAKQLSALMTPTRISEMKAHAVQAKERDQSTQTKNIRVIPPDPSVDQTSLKDIDSFGPDEFQSMVQKALKDSLSPQYPPLITLPCANVQAEKYVVCDKPGKMACGACKLVSYCSKVDR
jgi:hypothetical protein